MRKRKAKRARKKPLTDEEFLNRDNIDIEKVENFVDQYPEGPALHLLKAAVSAPLHMESGRKTRKQKKQRPSQASIVDRVEEEIGQRVPPEKFRDLVLEPRPELDWTKELNGYECARLSAENAMRRIFAATDAAQAGSESESPVLEVFFYKVRAGLIQSNSAEIACALQHAQRINKLDWFLKRLTDELHNAQKRVPNAKQFSPLRALLAHTWVSNCLWLMSNDVIGPLFHVTREGIRKAVKELKLEKHPETERAPIVKGVDSDHRFVFRADYPPKL
jgi:hypothetical protein